MIVEKAPGKLYIAGEYAVINNGNPAIIAAVNRFVTVSVRESKIGGSISSKQYEKNMLHWQRVGNRMVFDDRDNPFQFIISAIRVTEEYAEELGLQLKTYDINVNSQLDNADGRKYGLGSSAAVTVATVKALCHFYGIKLDDLQLFKLAAIAHFEVQGNGSLGDVAASVFGGYVAYHSFDRQWLTNARKNADISTLLDLRWPDLSIHKMEAPLNLELLIGWSGSPASTVNLVDKVELRKAKNSTEYQNFLVASRRCVNAIEDGFNKGDLGQIQRNINQNRKLLVDLGRIANVEIETPKLQKLISIADNNGGAAKTSGAGGGDCGIVIIDKSKNINELTKEWKENEIELLNLKVCKK